MLKDKTLVDYIEAVDSNDPTPGGGSVASLVGALGVALAKMLAHFSVEKKKFKEASKKEQDKFILAFKELEGCKDILVSGIDSDAISYLAVVDAFRSKDENKIQEALNASAFVALEMQSAAANALSYLDKLVKLGNKNVLSDLYSGAILLESSVELCSLNIKANANMLVNEEVKKYYLETSENNIKNAKKNKNKVIKLING